MPTPEEVLQAIQRIVDSFLEGEVAPDEAIDKIVLLIYPTEDTNK